MKRLIFSLIFLLSPVFLPWWLGLIVGLFGLFYFKNFLEFILWAFVLDATGGIKIEIWDNTFVLTLLAVVIFLVIQLIKKNLRYKNVF
jgi:hypothetical protein